MLPYDVCLQPECGCDDAKLDSPFRLDVRDSTINPVTGTQQWNFNINVVVVDVSTLFLQKH